MDHTGCIIYNIIKSSVKGKDNCQLHHKYEGVCVTKKQHYKKSNYFTADKLLKMFLRHLSSWSFCHTACEYFQELVIVIATIFEIYNVVQKKLSLNDFTQRFIMYQWHPVNDEYTFLQIRNQIRTNSLQKIILFA